MMTLIRVSVSYSQFFIYLAILFSLAACGFQLRGSIDLSGDISPVYIEQNSVFELAREIKSLLATNKIDVAKDELQAKSTLVLLNEVKQRRILSVDSSGRAKEYLLTYTVNFIIKVEQADDVNDSLSVSRSLLFNPDAVLAVTNESEILYRDMRRDSARLLLLRLEALSRNQAEQGTGAIQQEKGDTQ